MKVLVTSFLLVVSLGAAQHTLALEAMFGVDVNWVGISRSGGYKIETEVEVNEVKKVYYLDLSSDGVMTDFEKLVYSTLLTAKSSGQKVQIGSDDGKAYIKYLYLKEE